MAIINKKVQSEKYKNVVYTAVIDFTKTENEKYPQKFPIQVYLDMKEGTLGYKYVTETGESVGDFITLDKE